MTNTNNGKTVANILTAARQADGWYNRTKALTARFCTEALIDCAEQLSVPVKFYSASIFGRMSREQALEKLCGWASSERIREWGVAYQAARDAAILAMPEALAELGAAL